MRALYVEDNAMDADLVRRALAKNDPPVELVIAPAVQVAIEKLGDEDDFFDWVLLDLNLPDGDGLEVLRFVRDQRLPCIVIALTGAGDEKTVVRALRMGVDDYVVKQSQFDTRLLTTLFLTKERCKQDFIRVSGPMQVLYAENNADDSLLTLRHFKEHSPHIQLDIVTAGESVLQRLQESGKYNVVLLDYRLTGLDALEITKSIREVLRSDIPIVIVTGRGSEDVAAQALRLGVSDYVVKDPGYLFQLAAILELAHSKSQLLRERRRLEHLAVYDELTGLLNRTRFQQQARQAIRRAERSKERCGVILFDLDGFKHINDTFGHAAGDEALKLFADKIRTCMREGDLCCRLGGDEFIVLLEHVAGAEQGARLAERIIHILQDGVTLFNQEIQLTSSMGISLFPDDGTDVDSLIKNADLAMYQAKAQGRNQFHFFTSAMHDEVERRFKISADLHQAIRRNELFLMYQPQWDIHTGKMVAVEALLRWSHPEKGLVMPNNFIAVAEQSGQIISLGDWVIGAACKQVSEWVSKGLTDLRMAINISALQFRRADFLEVLQRHLERHRLAPHQVALELTESILAEDSEIFMSLLHELNQLDVDLSLDDFGTGYSSLSYLRRLPIKTLKIDRSFVKDLPGDQDAGAIVSGILAMAKAIGCRVVAEGVETQAQLDFLRARGCDLVQGFLLAPPLQADNIPALALANV